MQERKKSKTKKMKAEQEGMKRIKERQQGRSKGINNSTPGNKHKISIEYKKNKENTTKKDRRSKTQMVWACNEDVQRK